MKRIALAWVLSACGGGTTQAPVTSARAPTVTPPPPPSGPWTAVPAYGVRVACEGTVDMVKHHALVTCGEHVLMITVEEGVRTIDEAVANHDAERTTWLQAGAGDVKRSERRYRHAYENMGGGGTNFWIDVMVAIDQRVFVCQAVSMAPRGTRELAAEAGDLCETLARIE